VTARRTKLAALGTGALLAAVMTTVPAGPAEAAPPPAPTPRPVTLFVANANANSLGAYDTLAGTSGSDIPVGSGPVSAAVTPDGNTVYVTNSSSNSVSVVDVATLVVTATIPVGNTPFSVALSPDGSRAYVANLRGNSVSLIDTATNTVTATIPVGRFPEGIAVSPTAPTVYVVNDGDNNVSVIDTVTNTVTGTIAVGVVPGPVAFTPDGTKAYVGGGGATPAVSVISTSTQTVTGTFPASNQPFSIAVTPDGTTGYVANFVGGSVTVFDVATDTPTATISGLPFRTPTAIAVSPDGGTAYVADFNANTVIPIDTATNTKGTPITGYSGPEGIAITPEDTSTTLGVTPPSPAEPATNQTLTATVTPSYAIGTVQFFDGASPLGGPVALAGGTAATSASLGAGAHTLSAAFTPTPGAPFVGSASSGAPYTVKTPQTVAFTTTAPAAPVVGETYVPAASGGPSANPITLSIDPAAAGHCAMAGGTVTFTHPGLCQVDADLPGDSQYAEATATQTTTVTKAATSETVAVHQSSVTAAVQVTAPGVGTPTGSVAFSVNGNPFGTAPLVSGVATLKQAVPPGAAAQVSAVYSGDADFLPSSASTARHEPTIVPTVSSRAPATSYGWYRHTVHVSFACTANGAPLVGPCPGPLVLAHDGAGQSAAATVIASDGGAATATVAGINIDRHPPKVRIAGARRGATYDTAPRLRCVAHDDLSGVATCVLHRTKAKDGWVFVRAVATDEGGRRAFAGLLFRVLG